MKIAQVSNKKVGGKEYKKYMIPSMPKEIVEKSGLLGKKLKAKAEKGKITIEKA
ncbi:MAG: hypothetical protein P8X70_03250 [Nanoarchaeota archaeon]